MLKNKEQQTLFILLLAMIGDKYKYHIIPHETLPSKNIYFFKSTSPVHLDQITVVLPGKFVMKI